VLAAGTPRHAARSCGDDAVRVSAGIPALIAAVAFLGYWCARLAWADHLSRAHDVEAVTRAVSLAPGDVDFRLNLAAVQGAAGADPTPTLKSAAALEPGNAEIWIRLGEEAEVRGDFSAAERDLLEATRVSRQYAPRWALANYYFRRGDRPHFWHWMRQALQLGHGDMNPAYRLCWTVSPDGSEMWEDALPETPSVLNGYIRFLLESGRLAASESAALRLASVATPNDVSTVLSWCYHQLNEGSAAATVPVWNQLCARRLLPYAPVDPDRAPLTDGDFATLAPISGGFAWWLPAIEGVSASINRQRHYLMVEFSGNQPETCQPIVKYVPVTAGAAYRLRFEYRTFDIAPASGLRWSVFDARTGVDTADRSPWLSSDEWKRDELKFRAPAAGVVRLTLMSQRLPGATRISGAMEMRGLSMERLP
jgi:hypothetical protein